MKRKFLLLMLALTIIAGPALFFGCDLAPKLKSLAEDLFYSAVEKVAPTFTSTTSSGISSRAVTDWDHGNPVFELWGVLLKDPENSSWSGYFNLYDTMKNCDQYFSDISGSGIEITEQPVNAPVDVGFNGDAAKSTYDTYYAYDGADYDQGDKNKTWNLGRTDGDVIYMLHTSHNLNGGESKSVVQGWYNQETGELEIGIFYANYVDPDPNTTGEQWEGWEIVRAFIDGNTETHTFSLRIIRDGTGYDFNVTGYGVSEGTDQFFLMKMAHDNLDFSSAVYYEFAANATLSEIQAMDVAGSSTVPSNTTDYADDLPDNFTETDDLLTRTEVDSLDVTVSYTE